MRNPSAAQGPVRRSSTSSPWPLADLIPVPFPAHVNHAQQQACELLGQPSQETRHDTPGWLLLVLCAHLPMSPAYTPRPILSEENGRRPIPPLLLIWKRKKRNMRVTRRKAPV